MAEEKQAPEINLSDAVVGDISNVAEIEIPTLDTSATQSVEVIDEGGADNSTPGPASSAPSAGVKRKRNEPRDPNAPKRPSTAYIFFSSEMRPKVKEENPDMSLSERAKLIGKTWAALDPVKKQYYTDLAVKDRKRYEDQYIAYQETDSYKEYIQRKFPGLKKKQKTKDDKADKPDKAPAKTKTPLSCKQQFVPGSNIPIFSEEFLQHNREMESQLRKLRQSSANLEEENALLSRHMDNMKLAVQKVQDEVKRQQTKNDTLQAHLVTLREVLAATFKDVPLPESNETPTAETVDSYMGKLQMAISNEPEKHPVLMEKVSEIAKQLETVLKQKLTQEALVAALDGGHLEEQEMEQGMEGEREVKEAEGLEQDANNSNKETTSKSTDSDSHKKGT